MSESKTTNWQPIETAPKDGTKVELLCPHGEDEGMFNRGEWTTDNGLGEPTHWRPFQ